MRRARLFATGLTAASLLLAGCGAIGGDDNNGPGSRKAAAAQRLESTWPLTGLPVRGDDTSAQKHPVMVLKMDNTPSSSPQVGLGDADLVVEELVEGGTTRLAVFYYSQLPGVVGPVRSMRASDIGIVSPVEGAMVTSGAASSTITRIRDAGITFFNEEDKGFARDSSRTAPYDLMADIRAVASGIDQDEERPDDYLTWGGEKDLPKGAPATRLAADFGNHTTNWVYQGGGYVNQNTYAAAGEEFPADSVLVLRVQVGDAGYRDPSGNFVPETKLEGKGPALLFHGGRVVRATWSKGGLDAPLSLATPAGKLSVPAGHVWVELVPAVDGDVSFGK